MDLRQLEMFIAVAQNRSFTLAGEHLHVAQSAVSRKISMLEIELGVFTLPVQYPDLEVISFCREEMVVVSSKNHPVLSKKKSIQAAEIEPYPLILFPEGARTRKVLDDFFEEAGIRPRISMEAENVATIKPLVKINLGISIIPYRAVAEETKRQELHCVRIRDYELSREVGLVYQKSDHMPKILSELIRLFQESDVDSRPSPRT